MPILSSADRIRIDYIQRQHIVYLFTIVSAVVIRVDEQDILGLEIRVREFVIVQELDGVAELIAHVPDVIQRVRLVTVISLEKSFR